MAEVLHLHEVAIPTYLVVVTDERSIGSVLQLLEMHLLKLLYRLARG